MLKLYGDPGSGNCYKAQLMLSFLDIPYDLAYIDVMAGQTRTEAFLKMNPNGRIPLLQLESGEYLPESNAILHYLAEGTRILPDDRLARARVLQWMFFEQYSHEPYVAVLRFWKIYANKSPADEPQWAAKEKGAYAASISPPFPGCAPGSSAFPACRAMLPSAGASGTTTGGGLSINQK